jgi:hypothetical protein
VLKQVDNFRGVESVTHGRGDTYLFWLDQWDINGFKQPFCKRYPRLYSFVLDDSLSVAQVYNVEDLTSLFYLPLSTQAFTEMEHLQEVIRDNPLSEQNDIWRYSWGETYAAAKFYSQIHEHIQVPNVY